MFFFLMMMVLLTAWASLRHSTWVEWPVIMQNLARCHPAHSRLLVGLAGELIKVYKVGNQ